jgi:hypothetical protein
MENEYGNLIIMKHFITIVNQVEKLLPWALSGCESLWPHTTIIDNRHNPKELELNLSDLAPNINVYKPVVPLTTAQTMNLMLMLSTQANESFFTWQHSDACPGKDTVEKVLSFVERLCRENKRWGVVLTNHDAFAAYSTNALNDIGGWDWGRFPYYFLDNDIQHRLKDANYPIIWTGLPCEHEGSSTVRYEPERSIFTQAFHKASKALYEEKYKNRPSLEADTVNWKNI